MTEADAMLRDLWSQTQAPAPDPSFLLETMARVERRRFWFSVISLVPSTILVALVAWALAPLLTQGFGPVAAGLPAPTLAAVAGSLVVAALMLWRRPSEA